MSFSYDRSRVSLGSSSLFNRVCVFACRMTVIPQGIWHRFRSAEGVTLMTATPFPSETVEDDLDDPRRV